MPTFKDAATSGADVVDISDTVSDDDVIVVRVSLLSEPDVPPRRDSREPLLVSRPSSVVDADRRQTVVERLDCWDPDVDRVPEESEALRDPVDMLLWRAVHTGIRVIDGEEDGSAVRGAPDLLEAKCLVYMTMR